MYKKDFYKATKHDRQFKVFSFISRTVQIFNQILKLFL